MRAAILAMETNIRTVERIGRLLMYLGERDDEIEADALNALSGPLVDIGHDLHVQFADALAAEAKQAAEAGAP
ncbi:hypothetical protein ACRAWG_12705 [Methylobacterium sp. P31]